MRKLLILIFLCCAATAGAHEAHRQHHGESIAASFVFDGQGTLWRAAVNHGFVEVSSSANLGASFSKPVKINHQAQVIAAHGEARPKIAVSEQGDIYLTWTETLKKSATGNIWFARSLDKGRTFEKPRLVHQQPQELTRRYDALTVSPNGRITVAWIGKQDLLSGEPGQSPHKGAAIYYAVSDDHGRSFNMERKLADQICECCRIALVSRADSTVAALWRHIFEGDERDHMMAEMSADSHSVPKRATFGRWKIDGCPHHGPALAVGGEGARWWGYHMAWFDGGNDDKGSKASLYYARMDGEAWVSSPAKKFGNMKKQAAHPALASAGERVWLVWREKDAGMTQVWLMQSADEGKSWEDPEMLLEAAGDTDYPALAASGQQVYVLWNTKQDGLKTYQLQ